MINLTTDNIECDVCHADCGFMNEDGIGGYDKDYVWRDLCPKCAEKHHLEYCSNCRRLIPVWTDDFECPECHAAKDAKEQQAIARRVDELAMKAVQEQRKETP